MASPALTYLVTGGNKGIGFAIVKALLAQPKTKQVFLGARDLVRGQKARQSLGEVAASKCTVVQLDVTKPESIATAAKAVKVELGEDGHLAGLVNNAGIAPPKNAFGWGGLKDFDLCVGVNFTGLVNVSNAFLPLIEPEGGRIVMISSGAASMYLQKCSPEVQKKFTSPDITMQQIGALLATHRSMGEKVSPDGEAETEEVDTAFQAAGITPSVYGLTKAAVNCFTMFLAKKYPKLKINACSPGFIATDILAPIAEARGVTMEKMGAVPAEKGAICPTFLATGDVPTPPGKGYYYGSDAKRSPLHKYRSPGDAPYEDENY